MEWRLASERPKCTERNPSVHALCWVRWPDEYEFFLRGIYCEQYYGTEWHLDWSGSFSNDDAVVLRWVPLEELGITCEIAADGNSARWQLKPTTQPQRAEAGESK